MLILSRPCINVYYNFSGPVMQTFGSLFDFDTRYLTRPDSAVQGVDSVSWLVAITTVVTRVISCYYWWCLVSLMNTQKTELNSKLVEVETFSGWHFMALLDSQQ